MKLDECRILLTGASGGIGQALVERLCAEGARMLLVARQDIPLDYLDAPKERITQVQADLSQQEGRDAVVAAAEQFGGIDCLINAAGVNRFGLFEEQDEQIIEQLIQLNVIATLQLTQHLLPLLLRQPQALLINLGSTFGSIGYPGFAVYCASKFALRGFSEALRRELADTSIKVLYIAPRATRTKMNNDTVAAMNTELKVAMDEPKLVADAIATAIRNEQEEVYLGWPEKLFVRLNSLLPGMVDSSIRKQLPIIQRFARR